jgi:phosphoglycerol transferase MdoB-like AlkP superfamily enzyme
MAAKLRPAVDACFAAAAALFDMHFYPVLAQLLYAERYGREIVNWSDAETVINNGRFAMLAYREAEKRLARQKTDAFHDREAYDEEAVAMADWLAANSHGRNIHLVVMESFVDPTLFKAATYSKNPTHPDYEKMFAGRMGFSRSPVFGGRTSQAEFEVLCGVPAYEEMGGVEFNSFSGSDAWCLPGVLHRAGYRTIATNSFKPNFFNAVNAYRGIGFDEQYYPKEYTPASGTYLSTGDVKSEMYMFDGDLFAQNREFVRQALSEPDHPPLFNYVISMYGHLPHLLDKTKRPEILKITSKYSDDNLERVANQFWYRSQAVAEHVRELVKIDPDGLIIIVSDHLPPLSGLLLYHKLRYLDDAGAKKLGLESWFTGQGRKRDDLNDDRPFMNRILIIDRGTARKYQVIHHYDIPSLILDILADGEFCRSHPCSFAGDRQKPDEASRRQQYMRLMAHAIK